MIKPLQQPVSTLVNALGRMLASAWPGDEDRRAGREA
jgi:hypothetical protein